MVLVFVATQSDGCSCCTVGRSRKGCAVSHILLEMQRKKVEKRSLRLNIYEGTTRDKLMCDLKSNKPTTVSFI